MKWNQTLSVGVGEIDEQHKVLIGMLNKLHKAMDEKNSKAVLKDTVNELAEYTIYHFNTEERYFDRFDYKNSTKHKAEHKQFVGKVSDFIKDYEAGNALLSADILMFLSNWVQNHIKGSDKLYSSCFLEHGLGASPQTEDFIPVNKYQNTTSVPEPTSSENKVPVAVIVIAIFVILATTIIVAL